MNILIENGQLSEMMCGANLSYILNDNASFHATEYKFLQSQKNSCFVKCMKMLYNGKIQIYYMTKNLKQFSAVRPYMDADSFLTIFSNLLLSVIEIEKSGCFSCVNIDISLNRIYVDTSTYKVSLIYLPLTRKLFSDKESFENQIRSSFVKLISETPAIESPKVVQLSALLSDGTLSLEDLYNQIKSGSAGSQENGNQSGTQPVSQAQLRLISVDAPDSLEIVVTKDPFVIGRKAECCDGVIRNNKLIGRTHCIINKNGTQFNITDLESTNGTYLNTKRLKPRQPHPLQNGDMLRLANSNFKVRIK